MKKNFDKAVTMLLRHEGGYVNDPSDPGGETKYGISKRSYPDEKISDITKSRARDIYFKDYWQPCGCEELPSGIDIMIFDCAVNQGRSFAVRTLQHSVGTTVDGILGPKTRAAAIQANTSHVLREFASRRGVRYGSLPTFDRFGLGWMRRLFDIYHHSLNATGA